MILAGIDEAGYGPLLGPLVVGCCAFEVGEPAGEGGELPCLWKALRPIASKKRDPKGIRLHINDSKQVYTPATGLKELEKSVLTLLAVPGEMPADLDAFVRRTAPQAAPWLAEHPWYAPAAGEKFPIEIDPAAVRMAANAARATMQRAGVSLAHLSAAVLPEGQYNRMVAATRNKSSVLFSTAAVHLDAMLRAFAQRDLVIVCDRQGGREHYGRLLQLMFEDWALEITSETEGRSEYRLVRKDSGGSASARLIFQEKAERESMPVAVASMLCKYLREALMGRFNAWWRAMLPELTPTAGYYTDGMRFLQDIEQKRRELGIGDEALVRSR